MFLWRRLNFEDIPLHETNLLDGVDLADKTEVPLKGLTMDKCPMSPCLNPTLVIALDPTDMINDKEVIESGYAIGVNLSCSATPGTSTISVTFSLEKSS